MNRLLTQKSYVAVAEAAKHLSAAVGEEITEADVLQLGLEGQLTLSVYFVTEAHGWPSLVLPAPSKEQTPEARIEIVQAKKEAKAANTHLKTTTCDNLQASHSIDGKHIFLSRPEQVILKGVWDLAMIGGELDFVNNNHMRELGRPEIELSLDHILVVDHAASTFFTLVGWKPYDGGHFSPIVHMPQDAFLVVRTKNLATLCQSLLEEILEEFKMEAELKEHEVGVVEVEQLRQPATPWRICQPKRQQGYTPALLRTLKQFHENGHPQPPTAREVLECWRKTQGQHLELDSVLADEIKFYDAKGDIKAVGLSAIHKAIKRHTTA
ncbi:MAG TPA: hypothetical protein ENH72_00385 [Pseudomonas sabulinigri]|uniref:Uncharacterized protein n=1 Tax=marine sediment metagenome TaxID=412755 RepID=A0A0F9W6Y4_9ZZZZ|nr:hypothetical protein [Halopseudomonas sabulinigri]HEC51963.1 hypothetical protein [Halopseudomonas sabulinigri]